METEPGATDTQELQGSFVDESSPFSQLEDGELEHIIAAWNDAPLYLGREPDQWRRDYNGYPCRLEDYLGDGKYAWKLISDKDKVVVVNIIIW